MATYTGVYTPLVFDDGPVIPPVDISAAFAIPAPRLNVNVAAEHYDHLWNMQLDDWPAAAWPMQERTGTTLKDTSGNQRNGTYTLVNLDQFGLLQDELSSVEWTALTSNATVPHEGWMDTNEWTFEVVGLCTDPGGVNVLAARDIGGANRSFQFTVNHGNLTVAAWNHLDQAFVAGTTTSVIQPNTAHIYGARWKHGELSVWLDGVKVASAWTTGFPAQTTLPLVIGNYRPGVNNVPFRGWLSHAAYYDHALEDARLRERVRAFPGTISAAFTIPEPVLAAVHGMPETVGAAFTIPEPGMGVGDLLEETLEVVIEAAPFEVEDLVLAVQAGSLKTDTPIAPDPFDRTLLRVEMSCIMEFRPPIATPPGGLWSYDWSTELVPPAPGWEAEV